MSKLSKILKRNKEFPVQIRRGSVTVTVYRIRNGQYTKYAVRWSECGAEKRLNFSDPEEALEKAKVTATRLENGERAAISMSGVDAQSYGLAMEKLAPLAIPLHDAVDQFASAIDLLKGISLIEAARFYVKHHAAKLVEKRVAEVVEEFLAAREADGASIRYLQDCRSRLRRFAKAFGVNITRHRYRTAVSLKQIDAADGDWGLIEELRPLLPWVQTPARFKRDFHLCRLVPPSGRSCSWLEIFSRNYHPLFRVRVPASDRLLS